MRKHILALLVSLMAVGLTGCGDSNDFNSISGQQGNPVRPAPSPTTTPTPTPINDTFLRVAHLASVSGNVDVLLNGSPVLTNTPTAEATEYLQVEPGSVRVQVRATGTSTDLVDETRTVAANSYNTFAIIGNNVVAVPRQGVEEYPLDVLALVDNVTPAGNRINIRFVNILSLHGYNQANLAIFGGPVLAGPVDYAEATAYEDFSAAVDETSVEVSGGEGDDTFGFLYSTSSSGNNKNIVETLLEALGGPLGNVSAFFAYDGQADGFDQFAGYVMIDRPNNASEVYVFYPELVD